MRTLVFSVLVTVTTLSLMISGCGEPPDNGHVGPIGPVGPQGDAGPQGDIGPQDINGTTPANLTVIEDTGFFVTEDYSFSGFTRLEISDGFDVTIQQGSDYIVTTQFEETAIPYIQISQEDDTLIIMLEPERTYHMVNVTLDVEITMPHLTGIRLEDGADATLIGITDDFEIAVDFLSNLDIE